ncbi:MAG: hypothetical protein MJE68_29640 [Proteobacteria bacterium]|nr:hypothetical protein [Pseudomonadota bacterium]
MPQDILSFPANTDYSRGRFAIGACNRLAMDWLGRYPDWPGAVPGLIIHGETGCGKSHLAHIWQETTQADIITSLAPSFDFADSAPASFMGGVEALDPDRCYVLDGVLPSDAWDDDAVFLCLERFAHKNKKGSGGLLILAETPPASMPWQRADVASRLSAMTTAPITAPDDFVLDAVIQKLADDRKLLMDKEAIAYLLPRMERRFSEAKRIVDGLDVLSMRAGRRVTLPLIKQFLNQPEISDRVQDTLL